jgi:hypothetical protein
MKDRKDILVFSIMMAIGAVIIGYSLSLQYFSGKILPLVIGIAILLISLVSLFRAIANRKAGPKPKTGVEPAEAEPGLKRHLSSTYWMLGYLAGITIFGFIVSTPVFVMAYMRTHGSRWFQSALAAAITTGIIYGLFVVAFRISLYKGLLFK